MRLPARLAWIAVAVVLLAGGVALAMLNGTRSEAREEREQAVAEEERLEEAAEQQSERIEDLFVETAGKQVEREECLGEMRKQARDWNQLNDDTPTVFYSDAEIRTYSDRAMDLVDEAREAEEVCSEI